MILQTDASTSQAHKPITVELLHATPNHSRGGGLPHPSSEKVFEVFLNMSVALILEEKKEGEYTIADIAISDDKKMEKNSSVMNRERIENE